MKRDKILDLIRGAAVLHVMLVHILYWLDIFGTGPAASARSLLLFEMPVFFFVTGAVNSLGDHGPWGRFCLRRVKGLMIPYYGYAALCVALAAAVAVFRRSFSFAELGRTALNWLLPLDRQIMPLPFFTWAVWFVPVFLIVILLFLPVRRAAERFGGAVTVAALTAVFLAAEFIPGTPDILRKAAFYLIFAALGTQWQTLRLRDRKTVKAAAGLTALSAAGLFVCRYLAGGSFDMQANKFPPNHMFLLFSFMMLGLLYLAIPVIARPWRMLAGRFPAAERLVLLYSENSVYVFLYQSFAFLLAARAMDAAGVGRGFAGLLLSAAIVFVVVTVGLVAVRRLRRRKESLRKA